MVVVGIIGLLSILMVPGFVRNRMLSQGRRIISDTRQMDEAIDQWALELGMSNGATIDTMGAAKYLKRPWPANDLLGNAYIINTVGSTQIQIAAATKAALDRAHLDWGPY